MCQSKEVFDTTSMKSLSWHQAHLFKNAINDRVHNLNIGGHTHTHMQIHKHTYCIFWDDLHFQESHVNSTTLWETQPKGLWLKWVHRLSYLLKHVIDILSLPLWPGMYGVSDYSAWDHFFLQLPVAVMKGIVRHFKNQKEKSIPLT